MRFPVVFLHNTDGRPIAYHVGPAERLVVAKSGAVTLVRDGERIKLRESKKEIDRYVREVKLLNK